MRHKIVLLICVLISAAGARLLAEEPQRRDVALRVAELRAKFDEIIRVKEPAVKEELEKLDAAYAAALAKLEPGFAAAKNSFSLAAVRNERERIRRGEKLDEDKAPTLAASIGQTFKMQHQAREKLKASFVADVKVAGGACLGEMRVLLREYFVEWDFQGAGFVRMERRRLAEELHIRTGITPSFVGFRNLDFRDTARRFGNPPGPRADFWSLPMSDPGMAIAIGLSWLAKNQNKDGSWGDSHKGAMTGLGLLCFVGVGEGRDTLRFRSAPGNAVDWIVSNAVKFDGRLSMEERFTATGVYEHAICTFALCEYYTASKDESVLAVLRLAVAHIVEGQGPNGGWMYSYDKTADDLSVSGWQIQALDAARCTGLDLPGVKATIAKATDWLEKMQGPKGGYGYREPGDRYSLSGIGIFCRVIGGTERGVLRKGVEWLLNETETNRPVRYGGEGGDLYAWYFHTRACFFFGGFAWAKWERWLLREIVNAQRPDGSWPAPGGKGDGPQAAENLTGKVYRTALCMLMLETPLRYLPTLRR